MAAPVSTAQLSSPNSANEMTARVGEHCAEKKKTPGQGNVSRHSRMRCL